MAHQAAHHPRLVHHKPREPGAAHTAVAHDRRHKSIEGKYGVVGAGAVLTGVTIQSTDIGGDPNNYYPGIVSDANGLRAYNSGGTVTLNINAADGSVTVTGTGAITGGTIQTSVGFPKVILDANGLRAYNSGAVNTFNLDAATGNLTVSGTGTITGGTIQTAAPSTPARVIFDTAGIRAYNAASTQVFNLDASTGNLTVTGGVITGGTIQSAASGARVVMDGSGFRAYSSLQQTVNIGTDGSFSLTNSSAAIVAQSTGITITSNPGTLTGARLIYDFSGIKGYNASNTNTLVVDATTGLITATGVFTNQPGSTVPWQTTGFFIGGGNLFLNSSGEDPTTVQQVVYMPQGAAVTAGTFTLQYAGGAASAAINWNDTAATVATRVNAILPAGITVTAAGGPLPTSAVTLTFAGAGLVPTVLNVASSSLTGGTVTAGPVPTTVITSSGPVYGWTVSGGVLDFVSSSTAYHGGNVLRLTATASGTLQVQQTFGPYGLVAGQAYTVSSYIRSPGGSALQVRTGITWTGSLGGVTNAIWGPTITMPWNTSTLWQRAVGTYKVPPLNMSQQVSITGAPTGGTFKLTYNGQTTAALNWNATHTDVFNALKALSTVGASGVQSDGVYCTGGPLPANPIYVSIFDSTVNGGTASTPVQMMTIGNNSLTGGTSPAPVVAQNTPINFIASPATVLSAVAGATFHLDGCQVEVGDAPTAYAPRPDEILADTIQANMINVNQLSAISANLGTVTAGTMTGATVQTATTGSRVVINSGGLTVYDSGNNPLITLLGSTNTITGATVQTSGSGTRVYMGTSSSGTGLYVNNGASDIVGLDAANGLRLVSGTSAFNYVSWHSGSVTGGLRGEVSVGSDNNSSNIEVSSYNPVTGTDSYISASTSSLSDINNQVVATAFNAAGSLPHTVILVDGAGGSDFIRNDGNTRAARVWGGVVNVSWPGGSQLSNTATIAPGVSMTGSAICVVTPASLMSAFFAAEWGVTYIGGTNPPQWNINGWTSTGSPGAGTIISVYYIILTW